MSDSHALESGKSFVSGCHSLNKSQLLFCRLRSTIPGLGKVRNRRTSRHRDIRKRPALRKLPDRPEDLRTRSPTLLLALDDLLNAHAEAIQPGVGITPRIDQ